MAVDALLKGVSVNGSLMLHNKTQVTLDLNRLWVDEIVINKCTFGKLNGTAIANIINSIVDLVLPFVD